MCIIAIKRRGVAMFSDETIQTMFENNQHGAGLMYLKQDGKVHIEKGFMDVDKLLKYVHRKKAILDSTDVVMHFRIATSGKRDELGCHPYSVWGRNTSISTDVEMGMVHNGTLDGYGWEGNKEVNDTQIFIKNCLKKLPHNFLANKGITDLISNAIGTNRLAFLSKDGIRTFGSFIKDGEYYYSNGSYKPRLYSSSKNKVWNNQVSWSLPTYPYYSTTKEYNGNVEEIDTTSLLNFPELEQILEDYFRPNCIDTYTFEDYEIFATIVESMSEHLRCENDEDTGEEYYYNNTYRYEVEWNSMSITQIPLDYNM